MNRRQSSYIISNTPEYFKDLLLNDEIPLANDQSKDKENQKVGLGGAIAQTLGIGKHAHIKKFPTGKESEHSDDCSDSCHSDAKEKRRQQMEYRKVRMLLRQDRKSYLFYPEDRIKQNWDRLISFCIIFTCFSTPLFLSFHEERDGKDLWYLINMVVDIIFGIDIIIIFFSAFYDDDYQLIDNLNGIARNYIFGWFFFDVLAILPFEEFSSLGNSENDLNG